MFIKLLKHINSLPFPLTIKHYYYFGDTSQFLKNNELNSSESWDVLRKRHTHFSIPEDRDEWLKSAEASVKKDGQDAGLVKRSEDVVKIVDDLNIKSIFSTGVGGAGLEYQIKKKRPQVKMICSEYSKIAVERLKKVFLECDSIIEFDMRTGNWGSVIPKEEVKSNLVLLYRIDIDLDNQDFKKMIENMSNNNIENILIILCGRLTLKGLFNRIIQRLLWKIRGIKYVFSGYLRTEKTFTYFWEGFYDYKQVECAGLKGFLLKKKL